MIEKEADDTSAIDWSVEGSVVWVPYPSSFLTVATFHVEVHNTMHNNTSQHAQLTWQII